MMRINYTILNFLTNSISISALVTVGSLVDIYGNFWYVSQENDFSKFLSLLESNIGIPLGRVFHNSAADSFEVILDSLSSVNFGLFAKRNRQRYIPNHVGNFRMG